MLLKVKSIKKNRMSQGVGRNGEKFVSYSNGGKLELEEVRINTDKVIAIKEGSDTSCTLIMDNNKEIKIAHTEEEYISAVDNPDQDDNYLVDRDDE